MSCADVYQVHHVLPFCGCTGSDCFEKLFKNVMLYSRPGHDFDPAEKAGKICYHCGKVAELRTCSQCHLAKYCSRGADGLRIVWTVSKWLFTKRDVTVNVIPEALIHATYNKQPRSFSHLNAC